MQNIQKNSCNVLITLLLVIISGYTNVAARSSCHEWDLSFYIMLNHRARRLLLSQTLSVISAEDENIIGLLSSFQMQTNNKN